MNILTFLEKHRRESFSSFPLNEVDALAFAQFSYLHVEHAAPYPFVFSSFGNVDLEEKMTTSTIEGSWNAKLLRAISSNPRYKDVTILDYEETFSTTAAIQFAALTLLLPTGELVICFRGTDLTLNGWKEDLELAYQDEIPAQTHAMCYVEKIRERYPRRAFYISGHSKGGNLASYCTLKMDWESFGDLRGTYDFDGPGYRDPFAIFDRRAIELRKEKIHKFVPADSMVGIMLESPYGHKTIQASFRAIVQHDPFFWKIDDETLLLEEAKKRTRASLRFEQVLRDWLASMDKEEIKLSANALIDGLGGSDAMVPDIFKNIPKTVAGFKNTIKGIPEAEQDRLLDNIKKLLSAYREVVKERAKAILKEQKENLPTFLSLKKEAETKK